jgi:hypothetical protein
MQESEEHQLTLDMPQVDGERETVRRGHTQRGNPFVQVTRGPLTKVTVRHKLKAPRRDGGGTQGTP